MRSLWTPSPESIVIGKRGSYLEMYIPGNPNRKPIRNRFTIWGKRLGIIRGKRLGAHGETAFNIVRNTTKQRLNGSNLRPVG